MPHHADRSLDVLGVRLTYREVGASSGQAGDPTLVFLHEGLGSVGQWRDVPDQLAERTGLRALVYNRRGHGTSAPLDGPRPVSFMHQEALVVLPAVLAALGIERPVLVGHSDGASIALIHAGAHPNGVRALVLEAPHVFVEDLSVSSIARVRTLYDTTDLADRLARHHGENTERMFLGWNDVWLDPAFRTWNIEASLPAITCPTLVLQGDADEYGTFAQVDAIAARVGGPCQVERLAGCGHAPHHDDRDRSLDVMATFIGRVLAAHGGRNSAAVPASKPVE